MNTSVCMRYMINSVCYLLIFLFSAGQLHAQVQGDYRTKKSGAWTDSTTWETYSDSAWINAVHYPTYRSGTITILHDSIIIESATLDADQIVIKAGSLILKKTGWLNLKNGSGGDLLNLAGLIIDGGTLNFKPQSSFLTDMYGKTTYLSGNISGVGSFTNNYSLEVNGALILPDSVKFVLSGRVYGTGSIKFYGVLNAKSGSVLLPLTVANSATLNINSDITLASFTNNGTINWNAGEIQFYGSCSY